MTVSLHNLCDDIRFWCGRISSGMTYQCQVRVDWLWVVRVTHCSQTREKKCNRQGTLLCISQVCCWFSASTHVTAIASKQHRNWNNFMPTHCEHANKQQLWRLHHIHNADAMFLLKCSTHCQNRYAACVCLKSCQDSSTSTLAAEISCIVTATQCQQQVSALSICIVHKILLNWMRL